jgi:glucoamylase
VRFKGKVMPESNGDAPGKPGLSPRWTTSAKSGVGTARNLISHVWFTISHGILNEIYFPRVDLACVRDMGMIVTDGEHYFSEEKRHTSSVVTSQLEGVPAFRLVNTSNDGRYRIEKEIFSDPRREVVLQWTRFVPLQGKLSDYHLYVLVAPHLRNHGSGNTGWVGDYKGMPMLFAERSGTALALASTAPWLKRSVGYVGSSDGWQDLTQNRQMTWQYQRAEDGNIALTAEIDLAGCGGTFILALGFGNTHGEAGLRARASLGTEFSELRDDYLEAWQAWHFSLTPPVNQRRARDLFRVSASVLRAHEGKNFPGAIIASLSIPWGASKGDDDLGGYHLVWPRDLVETAAGLMAAGAPDDARRVLHYLRVTQEVDGHWPQNMWLDGKPYWDGIQMDESSLPILLIDLLYRKGALRQEDLERLWPMVRRAAGFIACNGPVTQEDRWEEDAGYSPFTLAAEIAALLVAATIADRNAETNVAAYLRETADCWNAYIERWIYVTDTEETRQLGVEGYYVRIAPPETSDAGSPKHGFVAIKNRPPGQTEVPAEEVVSPDALALVRFGLRSANDPRIVNTVKVIDALLKVDLPQGPCWYRYNHDGYGEQEGGRPFNGTGVGRAWPLLVGERAHYELAAGRRPEAENLLGVMEAFANDGGLLPEQVWDGDDIPEHELFRGRPTGSAMPLVWAHSEYIKLRRSLHDGQVFDMPPQTVQRYQVEKRGTRFAFWRFNHKTASIQREKTLRVEVLAPAVVHWSTDAWKTAEDVPTRPTGLGIHLADLPTEKLPSGSRISITFYWKEAGHWEGQDFVVSVE